MTDLITDYARLDVFGASFGADEPDTRDYPAIDEIEETIQTVFTAFADLAQDTPLENVLKTLLWGLVNALNYQCAQTQRRLDDNIRRQDRLRQQSDNSEIANLEIEGAHREGEDLVSLREAVNAMFDAATHQFLEMTGDYWRPTKGSTPRTNRASAAWIDSHDFCAAQKRKWDEDHLPNGPFVIFSAGEEWQDVGEIWGRLDAVLRKHGTFTLLHGNAPGADRIAARWASNRGVDQIAFRLETSRLGSRAGFERNLKMLDTCPLGILTGPGNGVVRRLREVAITRGLKVWHFEPPEQRDPKDIIRRLGTKRVARHFKVENSTVKKWMSGLVPKSRIDDVIALDGMVGDALPGQVALLQPPSTTIQQQAVA